MRNAFLIAATSSGCGKTTLSLGIMRALKRRGLNVQPFKCGPDYIDTQYHNIATGNESVNLDLFMATENHVKALFDTFSSKADVSITEGVMGMFDGYDKMTGSSADMARRIGLPVILLVNAASTAYSVAATIYGFVNLHKDVDVAGVIFNRVTSENHYSYLLSACKEIGVESFGYLSRDERLSTPSRHLGLTLSSVKEMNSFIDTAANEVERHVDLDRILRLRVRHEPKLSLQYGHKGRRVAVARDEAFNFIYPANLLALESDITFFSPLNDTILPESDMVYIPGGYPELFSSQLEANRHMKNSICEYVEKGGKLLAECGGLIYMSEEIDGHKMCGVFNVKSTMEDAKLSLGYRKVDFANFDIRGHEFHYSKTICADQLPSIARQYNAKDREVGTPVYRYKNAIAGYTHLYWAEKDIFKLWDL